MKLEPELKEIPTKQIIGLNSELNLLGDQIKELWKAFMPRKKEINNLLNSNLYAIQIYPLNYDGNPNSDFTMWVGAEVSNFNKLPKGLASFSLPGGKYAVFTHKGTGEDFPKSMGYIFGKWLPNSTFQLDSRPHFNLMGPKYLGENNPNSEEEIWIPIK